MILKMMLIDEDDSVVSELYRLWNLQGESNIKIVADASSFEDAFRKYWENKPDIVLTEFQIGEETASEWMKRVREQTDQETEFVVLTSSTDFRHVKAAFESGADSYLLKPVLMDELLQTLRKLCRKMKEKRQTQHLLKNYYDDLPKLKKLFLKELAHGILTDGESIKEKSRQYQMPLQHEYYRILLFAFSEEMKSEAMVLLAKQISACMRLHANVSAHEFYPSENRFAVLLGYDEEKKEEFQLLLNDILNLFRSVVVPMENGEEVAVGISESFCDISDTALAYKQAKQALTARCFSAETIFRFYAETTINRQYDLPVRLAMDIVHNRYEQVLTVSKVADEVFVSDSYLMHIFKKNTGMTFHEYLTEYRIQTAIRLMKNKKYRLYEIGEKVGYHNSNSFRQAFKKVTGYSPKDYLNNEN